MSAGQYNIIIEQGASFYRKLTWTDRVGQPMWTSVDSITAKMQIRTEAGGDLLIELSTENNRITLSENGVIELNISAADTGNLTYPLPAVHDLEITQDTTVTRLIEGTVTIKPEVTV
jgi:hypothetical protein